ncbi:MAG: serine O-acetyltransferase, partial [Parvibaculales bacterium]
KEISQQARGALAKEPKLKALLQASILDHESLPLALSARLAEVLGSRYLGADMLRDSFGAALKSDLIIAEAMEADIEANYERDPACRSYLDVVLFFKGFHALQAHRLSHFLYRNHEKKLALYLQSQISDYFGVDIHPDAKIGKGIMIDHAEGVVIGETAIVGDDVSMLHGVTLGGLGKEVGDRHPKIGKGVLLSVGAKILGNIHIGDYAKVGAGSVVLQDVPAYKTAVGVPAKIIGEKSEDNE